MKKHLIIGTVTAGIILAVVFIAVKMEIVLVDEAIHFKRVDTMMAKSEKELLIKQKQSEQYCNCLDSINGKWKSKIEMINYCKAKYMPLEK